MKILNKQAQLTLIIITGIVFLISIGMVIWIGGTTATRRTAPEAEQQRLRQVAVQPVKEYIQSCLDITTSTAIELLGKQGGVLYRSQGGLTQDVRPEEEGSRFVKFENLNVSYVILAPSGTVGQYFSAVPEYPFKTFPHVFKNDDERAGEIIATHYTGYFGVTQLPPLLKPGKESIQEQLESYINANLPRCTTWETFKPQGLTIIAQKPKTAVLIAENITQIQTEQYLTVVVNWTVNITDQTTGGTTILDQFSIGYPVHLAKFYLFVQSIVYGEVSNSSFDPRNLSTQATPVVIVRDVYVNPNDKGRDDIIMVQDAESFLRGKPIEFRLLRKNRAPALVWINWTDLDRYKFVPTATCNLDAENIFLSGKDLLIKWGKPSDWKAVLTAADPDEDTVVFTTKPPAPAKIKVPNAGADFYLYVYASDGSINEDSQVLKLHTDDCPIPS